MSGNVAVQLDKYRDQALRSLLAGDYAGARTTATACLLILATIPDGELANLSRMSWSRTGIVAFIEECDRQEATSNTAATGGMILQDYSYTGRRSC